MSKKITMCVGTVIVLILGSVWAFWNRTDPQVEKIKQMGKAAFQEGVKPEERRQQFELIHQEMEKLSPEQRQTVFQEGRKEMERRMDERIDAYLALPPNERNAFLDKEIQEGEKRRKEWESRQQTNGANMPNFAGQQANAAPRPPQSNNPGDRTRRRNEWMDNSTPEQRAKRSLYFADMQKRRYELGLPLTPPRGPGGPR